MGARGEDLKSLINYYASMLENLEYLSNFSICFTQVPDTVDENEIKAKIENIFEHLSQNDK